MNIRLAGSQTVVRPEFREVSPLAYYDFDLGATVIGNKSIERTKITSADLRWEFYQETGKLYPWQVSIKTSKSLSNYTSTNQGRNK